MTDTSNLADSADLWNFAVQLYGRPGVAEACVDLQDRCGLDVDLLLFAVWCAVVGPGQLDVSAFRECIAVTDAWREGLLKPLRALRRHSSGAFDPIPEASTQAIAGQLQAVELAAERVELELLESWAASRGTSRPAAEPQAAAASNLVAYLAAAGVETGTAAAAMRLVLAAAFTRSKPA